MTIYILDDLFGFVVSAYHDHSVSHTFICCHGYKVLIIKLELEGNSKITSKVSDHSNVSLH